MGFMDSVGQVLGFGRDESKGEQVVRAGPRTSEATQLWQDFIKKFLGGGGYQDILEGQEESLKPYTEDYTGYLDNLLYGTGTGEDLRKPVQFSFGGNEPISIYPKGQRDMIKILSDLATQKYGAQEAALPGWSKKGYLDTLWPMLMETEGLRYSIPSTSGTLTGPKQNLLSWLNRAGQAADSVGKGAGNIASLFSPSPSTVSPATMNIPMSWQGSAGALY